MATSFQAAVIFLKVILKLASALNFSTWTSIYWNLRLTRPWHQDGAALHTFLAWKADQNRKSEALKPLNYGIPNEIVSVSRRASYQEVCKFSVFGPSGCSVELREKNNFRSLVLWSLQSFAKTAGVWGPEGFFFVADFPPNNLHVWWTAHEETKSIQVLICTSQWYQEISTAPHFRGVRFRVNENKHHLIERKGEKYAHTTNLIWCPASTILFWNKHNWSKSLLVGDIAGMKGLKFESQKRVLLGSYPNSILTSIWWMEEILHQLRHAKPWK